MDRKPCYYCKAEDGVDRLGIGFSARCGAHYYRPAFPPEVEAPEQLFEEIVQLKEAPPGVEASGQSFPRKQEFQEGEPVEQPMDEGATISMFPMGPGPSRPMI